MANDAVFIQRGLEYLKTHPDLNEKIARQHMEGFDMDPAAVDEIKTLGRPELLGWILDDSRTDDAHALNNLRGNPEASREFVRQLAERVDRQGYGREAYSDADTHLAVRAEARLRGLSTTQMLALRGDNSALSPTDAYITARKLRRRR